jgi:GT2 family glycosyltransferase
MSETASISAMVTGYDRETQLLETLTCIASCIPPPDEILVHIDGGRRKLAAKVRQQFPKARVLLSEKRVGPGGGRNQLIHAARHEWVASFDDDSRPLDPDYFAKIWQVASSMPEVAVIAATVFLPGEVQTPISDTSTLLVDFVGCGCVVRKSAFERTSGYVELPIAYGMEEVDLALRLVAIHETIVHTKQLRVLHSSDESHHREPAVTAATIANVALHAYLRYPLALLPLGFFQCITRVLWLLAHRRTRGLIQGLASIPLHLWKHRALRSPVSEEAVRRYRTLRDEPCLVTAANA